MKASHTAAAIAFPAKRFKLHTEIIIQASPAHVWEVFSDTDAYPEWNPLIHALTGPWKSGERLHATIDGMKFKPVVLEHEPNRQLTWRGRLLFPGLFEGTHCFQLVDHGDGTTTFVQSESFRGLLVPLMKRKLKTDTLQLFHAMNAALKKRVKARLSQA